METPQPQPLPFPQTPATNVRLLHFADVHLGVEAYGRPNSETGLHTRLEDFTRSLNSLIDRALAKDIDLALFAGDAYKARDPSQTQQREFAKAIRRLTDRNIPVALLIGNHDIPNTRGRAHTLEIYGLLAEAGVRIFSSPELVEMPTRKGVVLIGAMPYLIRARVLANEETKGKTVEEVAHLIRAKYTDYLAGLATQAAAKPDYIALLMGHFTVADSSVSVQNFLTDPGEPQVPLSSLALPHFDYVALGHIHKHQSMSQRDRQPPVVYSGSIERVDLGEVKEDKGGVIANVRKGHADWEFLRADIRPMHDIKVACGDTDDPMAAIQREIAKYPIVGSIVRVRYTIAHDRASLVRLDEVRAMLNAAHHIAGIVADTGARQAATRSQEFGETITPERALGLYLEQEERLKSRKEELMTYARPILEAELQQEGQAVNA